MAEMPAKHVLLRGSLVQQVRLYAGLVLLAFAATHFLYHAAGLFGLAVMEEVQTLRFAVTRSWVGSVVLGLALLAHMALGLLRLAERRTLRMPLWESFQIASGLLIPLLMFRHIAEMRGAATLFGTLDFYRPSLVSMWPERAVSQSVLLLLVWCHGAVGIHHWLRLAPWYRSFAPLLLGAAILVPALALAGFAAAGREVAGMLPTEASRAAVLAEHHWPGAGAHETLYRLWLAALALFLVAVVIAIGPPIAAVAAARRSPRVAVTYTAGPIVKGALGATLLEISRAHDVPHASVCGGRARCSTCRVRVDLTDAVLAPPVFAEAVTLGAIGAPAEVRLACQLRPPAALTVTRLVAPGAAPTRVPGAMIADAEGVERQLVVMFLDLKGFTALSEKQLPYDVVFLLNRLFRGIGAAIASEGGWIDKYMGDGLLAVFGRETGLRAGAMAALGAASHIDLALDRLNAELEAEGMAPVGVGIGLHAGPMIVGRVGYGEAAQITVIGATVNLASRLEALTREKGCQLILSRAVVEAAALDAGRLVIEPVTVRGLEAPVEVALVGRARDLVRPSLRAS